MNKTATLLILASATLLSACGGGGGGTTGGGGLPPVPTSTPIATSTPTGGPTPTSTPTSSAANVGGVASLIPNDGFGPATILGTTYSFDSAGSPLTGAMVIVGPVPIIGATPPATLPAGDVSTTTSATGAFAVTVTAAATVATSALPFVIPTNNITGFTPPATGYYVEIYGVGTDGKSAGAPLPLHEFVAPSTSLALHVTSTSAAEAAALAIVNSDRAANGAGPLVFDEAAEEAARLHAYDLATQAYFCHYDVHNVGPGSRYLRVGGLGLTGEGIGGAGGVSNPTAAFQQAETTFLAEKSQIPQGGHFTNLVDVAHLWAGLGIVASSTPQAYVVDYELVTPSAQDAIVGASGYTNAFCPTGITNNNS